ncbi:MAG: MCP four helix bundle domain-containing protein, partial [Methylococcales bacterium]
GLQTVYLDRVVPLKDLKIIADMYAVNIVDTTHKVRNGNISWQEASKNVDDAEKTIQEKWDGYLATVLVAEEEKLVAEIKPLLSSTQIKVDRLQAILNRNDNAAVSDFSINELYPAIDPISTKFSELIDVQLVVAKQEYETAQSRYQTILIVSIVSLAVGLLLAIGLGLLIIRQILSSITAAQKTMTAIANGDLSSKIDTSSNDELGVMLRSTKVMQDSLSQLVKEINETVNNAVRGDFSNKIVVSDKKGFGRDISESLNQLSDIVDMGMNDTMRVVKALANGDLSQKITADYHGVFGQTKDSVNYTVDELRKLIEEVDNIVYSGADCGDFSVKMSM